MPNQSIRVFTLGVLFLGACSPDTSSRPQAVVADSAGLRVVSYDLTDLPLPQHRVLGEHDLEIGDLTGSVGYALSDIVDLAVTDDGMFVVSDRNTQALLLYDATGRYLRTLGRAGEGPGEFASAPTVAGLSADTIFAFDIRAARLTTWLRSGSLVETLALHGGVTARPTAVIRLNGGELISRSPWVPPNAETVLHDLRHELDSIALLRLDAAGSLIDTLRVMADQTRLRTVQGAANGNVRVLQITPPLTPQARVATDGIHLLFAHSEAFQFELNSPDLPNRLVRISGAHNPATAADIRAYQEADLRERFGDRPVDPTLRQVFLDAVPQQLPAFGDIVVTPSELWVSRSEFDLSNGLDWLVFTWDGELKGSVYTPPEFRLLHVSDRFVVGFILDEFDVPYVRRYPLD